MALRHARPGEVVDLRPLGTEFGKAQTEALTRTEHFEAIRLVLPADREIPSHHVNGSIMLHCLEGNVSLGLDRGISELKAGDWLYLEPGQSHSVKAHENSSLLLIILLS
ncbi:MAG: AraC family ligand binding domain-containing protein [Sphingomonadales bacterium]